MEEVLLVQYGNVEVCVLPSTRSTDDARETQMLEQNRDHRATDPPEKFR